MLMLLLVSSIMHGAEPFTNHLAIHLLADRAAWISNRTVKPYGLNLIAKPIVSDADFVTFDVTNQTFTTSAAAAQHLNGLFNTNDLSMPFVLVASGEPIYVGVFESPLSFYLYFTLPVVHPDRFLDPMNRAFQIQIRDPRPRGTNAFLTTLPIGSGAQKMLGQETNILNDPRIISAVQKLFAHDEK